MHIRFVTAVLVWGLLAAGHAAPLTWDADPAAAGLQDGAGTWDAVATNWWDGLANTNWNDAAPDSAIIGAAGGAAGTITVSGTRALGGLTFNVPGSGSYLLSGGTLELSNSPVITANADAQIDSTLAGSGFIKAGTNQLTLGGLNTYSGATVVASGTLAVAGGGSVTGTLSLITRSGGTAMLTNGSLTLADSVAGVFGVGYGAVGTGTVIVRAGSVLSVGNGLGRTFIGGGPNGGPLGVGVLTVDGGEVRVGPAGVNPNDSIYFNGYGGSGTSILNLNGGAFVTARILTMGSAFPGVINWNGGTLRAATNSGNLVAVTAVNVLGGGALFDDGGFAVTISSALLHGAVPVDGGLTKLGAGTLTLTGQHTYQGVTMVSNGVLALGGGATTPLLPASNTIVVGTGATLRFSRHDSFGIHTTTSSPAIVVNAGGFMASAGTFTTIWNPTLNGGTIRANGGANAAFPAFQLAGTLNVGGSQASSITAATNAFSVVCIGGLSNATLVINVADATLDANPDLVISAPLQNSPASLTGSPQKTGSGTLVLAATNSFTGSLLVQGGVVQLAPSGALPNVGNIGSISGAVLEVAGPLTQSANKYFATGSGLAGTTGTTIIQTGAVVNLGGNAVVIGGGLNNGANFGSGSLVLNGGTVNVGAGVSGAGVEVGSIWINPYGGAVTSSVTLNGGVLNTARGIADGGTARSRVNFNGGTLRIAAHHANFLAVTKADLQAGGGILDVQGYTVTVRQAFSGDGALTKIGAGALTLAGSSSHTGATVISEGTLLLGGVNSLSPASALTMANGTTLSAGTNRQTVSALNLGQSAADTLSILLTADGNGLPGYLTVTNVDGLSIPGVVTLRLANPLPPVGATNILFRYTGTAPGATNLTVVLPSPRAQVVITNNEAAGQIELILADLGHLRWVGNLTNGWDLSGATNWVLNNLGSPAGFINGDRTIFDDQASNFVVTLAEPVSAGTVAVTSTNAYTFQGAPLDMADDLQLLGTGTTLIWNAQTFPRALFTNGAVVVGDGGTNGALAGSGVVINHGALVFDRSDAVTSLVQIAGSGTWVKRGDGALILSNSLSSYRGDATIAQGAVIVKAAQLGPNPTNSALGNPQVTGRQILVSTNSMLAFAQHDALGNAATSPKSRIVVDRGTLASDGHLVLLGPLTLMDSLVVASNAAPTAYGFGLHEEVLVPSGTSMLAATGASGFYLSNIGSITTVFQVATGAALEIAGPVRNGWDNPPSRLVKAGEGRLVLSGASSYSGGTFLPSGELSVGHATALGTGPLIMAGGLLTASGGARSFANTVQMDAASTVDTTAGDLTFTGPLTNGATLVKQGAGMLTLAGSGAHTGTVIVSDGTLAINGTLGTDSVILVGNATLAGSGSAGIVTNAGIVAPGVEGMESLVLSSFQALPGSTLAIELAGFLVPGTDYDQLLVTGNAELDGTLNVSTNAGYVPAEGNSFTILTATNITGGFAATNLPALAPGQFWDVRYSTTNVMLVVTSAPALSGFDLWAQSITNEALRGYDADADGDGYANLLEYSQGTDPTNDTDRARVVLVKTGEVYALKFNFVTSAVDLVYHVEASYALTNDTGWEGIKSNYLGEGWTGDTTVTWTNAGPVIQIFAEDNDPYTSRRGMRLRVERP